MCWCVGSHKLSVLRTILFVISTKICMRTALTVAGCTAQTSNHISCSRTDYTILFVHLNHFRFAEETASEFACATRLSYLKIYEDDGASTWHCPTHLMFTYLIQLDYIHVVFADDAQALEVILVCIMCMWSMVACNNAFHFMIVYFSICLCSDEFHWKLCVFSPTGQAIARPTVNSWISFVVKIDWSAFPTNRCGSKPIESQLAQPSIWNFERMKQ